jgi:hypothetical protein
MLSLYSRQGAAQRRQLWLKSVNLVLWLLPGLATRYHQKERDIIIIGGHCLGAFIQPSKNTAMKLNVIKGTRASLFCSLKGGKPCHFRLNHARRTDPNRHVLGPRCSRNSFKTHLLLRRPTQKAATGPSSLAVQH